MSTDSNSFWNIMCLSSHSAGSRVVYFAHIFFLFLLLWKQDSWGLSKVKSKRRCSQSWWKKTWVNSTVFDHYKSLKLLKLGNGYIEAEKLEWNSWGKASLGNIRKIFSPECQTAASYQPPCISEHGNGARGDQGGDRGHPRYRGGCYRQFHIQGTITS